MKLLRIIGVLVVIALVFLYRFNTLGGSLGGFDDDHFINLVRANQLLEGDWPLRDYPDGSLQGAWPPVTYMASAGAQRIFGRSLLAEAVLTTGAIAVAAGVTAVAGANLTGFAWMGGLAAILSVIPSIKLYGYARPLLFSTVLLLVFRYLDRQTFGRLAAVSAALALAFLTRHDYAVYLGLSVVVGMAVAHRSNPRMALRRVALCAGVSFALLVPTVVMVQNQIGVSNYIRTAREVMLDEQTRTNLGWPVIDVPGGWTEDNNLAALYYLFMVLPVIAAGVAVIRARHDRASGGEFAKVLTLCAAGALTNHFLLRGNLEARLSDTVLFHALAGVWLLKVAWQAGTTPAGGSMPRLATAGIASVLVALSAVSLGAVGSLPQELGTSRFKEGASATFRTTARVWGILRELPPTRWQDAPDQRGDMLVAAYLSECTPADARILNATYATDYLVFARRGFAAGHANFVPGLYNSPRDQVDAITRARRQSVPVAVTDPVDIYQKDFVPDFPLVDQYLQERYIDAGTIDKDGVPSFRILVERSRQPSGSFADTGLPCFQ